VLPLLFKLFTTKFIVTIWWSKYLHSALIEVCCCYLLVSRIGRQVFRMNRRDCFSFLNLAATLLVVDDVAVVVVAVAVAVPVVVAAAGTFVSVFAAATVAVAVVAAAAVVVVEILPFA